MKYKSTISHTRRSSVSKYWSTIVLVLAALPMVSVGLQAVAQSNEEIWATPVNLSHSGAASSPAIVAQPGGALRIFWWDRFDGVTAASGSLAFGSLTDGNQSPDDVGVWSEPLATPIRVFVPFERPNAAGEAGEYVPIAAMPRIVGDAAGRAHAFWLGVPNQETGARPLLHASLPPGSTVWSTAQAVASAASEFAVTADAAGGLHLAYVRDLHQADLPAGIYYRRSTDGGASWRSPVALAESRYYRLLSPEAAYLDLAVDADGAVYLTWDAPELQGIELTFSPDGGVTWDDPHPIRSTAGPVGSTSGGERPQRGRLIPVPGGEALLLWEVQRPNGTCALYQAAAGDLLGGAGEHGTHVLPERLSCKQRMAFLPLDGELIMAVEEADGALFLATWDGSSWKRSRPLALRFADPELGGRVQLCNLRLALNSVPSSGGEEPTQALAVVGTDENGEVWVTGSPIGALGPVLAPVTPTPTPTPRLRLPGTADADIEGPPPQPVNLSRSGAASSPQIVVGPGSTLRAFWWDAFDGLMIADGAVWSSAPSSGTQAVSSTLDIWSDAVQAPILRSIVRESARAETVEARPGEDEASGEQTTLMPIDIMPRIVADATGRSHALWLQEPDTETGSGPLMYSALDVTSIFWSSADILAESAVTFDMAAAGDRTLHLVYLRAQHTGDAAAGVYHRRSDDGGATWSIPVAIDTSRYYRMLSSESAHLRLAADGAGGVYAAWDHPHLERLLLAGSSNDGVTWGEPIKVGNPDARPQHGRLFGARTLALAPGESQPEATAISLLWEDASQGEGCALYQSPVREVLENPQAVGQRVLDELAACPQAEQFLTTGVGEVLMITGGGSDTLTLVAWNGEQWSEPRRLGYRFQDPTTRTPIYLGDLHAALVQVAPADGPLDTVRWTDKSVVVVGTDENGDVWVTPSQTGALEVVFAPPSPWSTAANVSTSPTSPDLPAMATDADGWLHILWAEPEAPNRPEKALYYARWDGQRWTRPAVVLRSPEGSAGEPALVVEGDLLHALWSDGSIGRIWHSRAFVRDAYATGGWSEAQPLPLPDAAASSGGGSWPHIIAFGGVLHAVYAVPVNEGRGIYHVCSDDSGASWLPARQIFDAVEAGWAAADYPRLAIDAEGILNVVWVRAALAPGNPPQSIHYARSHDGGETWTEPLTVVEGDYAWPRVAVSGPGRVHLLWQEAYGGNTWHRWSADASTALTGTGWEGWTRGERVPGLGNVPGPLGVAADGAGTLHVAGLGQDDAGEPALLHIIWEDPAELTTSGGRWDRQETVRLNLEPGDPGMSIALQPALGLLDAVFRGRACGAWESGASESEGTSQAAAAAAMDLWHMGRAIPPVIVTPPAVASARPTATPLPTPTPQPAPTPTPDLSAGSSPAGGGSTELPIPLLLGGGLAGLIVAGVFGIRFLSVRRR